ncbi:hypothetical protein, partial [Methanocaldococcus sp.]
MGKIKRERIKLFILSIIMVLSALFLNLIKDFFKSLPKIIGLIWNIINNTKNLWMFSFYVVIIKTIYIL